MLKPNLSAQLKRLRGLTKCGVANKREFLAGQFRRVRSRLALREWAGKSPVLKLATVAGFLLLGAFGVDSLLYKSVPAREDMPVGAAGEGSWSPGAPGAGDAQSSPPIAAASSGATASPPAPVPDADSSDHAAVTAFSDGWRFSERLFLSGSLFSELNPKAGAQSYPTVYRKIDSDPRYAAKFYEGARSAESELVRKTLGEPPMVDGGSGPVLSAQVAGPVGHAIQQGLNEPGSYRHDARDSSRPRPCYFQHQWCWKIDKFWYRSRSAVGGYVKDCIAAVVVKESPYCEYRVVTLQEAKF